jgi:hypothetical protein
MSNDNFSRNPYTPAGLPPPPGANGCVVAFNGCLVVIAGLMLLLAVFCYLVWPDFAAFGTRLDLVEYKDAVEHSNLDPQTQAELIGDLETVRLSIDDRNQFHFLQWLNVDKEVVRLLNDRQIDGPELAKLKAEIGRMKKIQGLQAK